MKNLILFLVLPLLVGTAGLVAFGASDGVVRHEVVVSIERRPSEVFPWLFRPDRVSRWRRDLVSSGAPSVGNPRVGSRWREVVGRDQEEHELEVLVTELTRGRRLGLTLTGPGFKTTAAYVLQAEGRTTRLLFVSETTYEGFFTRLFAPLSSVSEEARLDESFSRLAAMLETGT